MSIRVRAQGVDKSYRDGGLEVDVLQGVDLCVEPGELVAVVGPSGSGKSTLLHLLGGLDRPDAGTVSIGDTDLARLSATERAEFRNRTVGFVFQFHQLLPDFTALENVMLPGRIAGRLPEETLERARRLLADVGLAERQDHFPAELSGGESQRVALCRALALDPPLVLADEPTGNLDPASGERVLDLFLSLQERRGTTGVLVTHNPEVADRCARIFELDEGVLKPRNPSSIGVA
jgi:lipoprotein-releasing system ATP-binding protein